MPNRADQAVRLVRSVLPMVAALILIVWGLIDGNIALVTLGAGALGVPATLDAVSGRPNQRQSPPPGDRTEDPP